MKGIYLTRQGKDEIEAKIAELKKDAEVPDYAEGIRIGRMSILKELLSAKILPVEGSWNHFYSIIDGVDTKYYYPNGVIIQPKQ